MDLKPLIQKLKKELASSQAPGEDFFHDVALLDQTVRQAQASKEAVPDLSEAEELLLHLWRNDLYCRFLTAPKVPPDSYLCQNRQTGYHPNPTGEEDDGPRPILIAGGAFESNRHRH